MWPNPQFPVWSHSLRQSTQKSFHGRKAFPNFSFFVFIEKQHDISAK